MNVYETINYTGTLNPGRLKILLLIGALAMFTLWLIGLYAETKKIHFSYQANTVKSYRVLSLIYLGLQILIHEPQILSYKKLAKTLKLS